MVACSGQAAGLFTTNKVRAAPLEVTAEHLMEGRLDGIIANSGCANAFTGKRGLKDARSMAGIMASVLGTEQSRIAVASTGVIGRYLDLDLIRSMAEELKEGLRNSPEASREAAKAIMTTDTRVKEVAVEHQGFRVAGICKGAGMIEPNMATMLAFLYTDAKLDRDRLQSCLRVAVDQSFNMLTVDGDTSTNDTVILTSTGAVSCDLSAFQEALSYVCINLAKKMARDGEGATKAMEVLVQGARSDNDARLAAKAVARSNLVKAALYGADPNWGRIVCAAGRSGAELDPGKITLSITGAGKTATLVEKGSIVEGILDKAKEIMKEEDVLINLDLGLGSARARSFGCDLTHGYVDINASYTT
jgi:glutamate N-acetyltransferase/amino-acid N-acetyltransferase